MHPLYIRTMPQAVARRVDPAGKFRNEMLDRLVAAAADSKL